ncbi:MAG: hypothetical protein IPP15_04085 [Saprospiraceae bacterium]|uniref:Lipoprotein n=1 Tax=Candidatus Opimibacter skivensis TaxID=2982028 RepID=A0A9D7XMV6_9BACT|nr:hypothetical protein [Candidatus Opimibacter skivensis]
MNKLLKSLLIICITLYSLGCKTTIPATAEVNFLNANNGVINLRSIGYGKTNEECLQNAQKNAFETLFFRGIPGSQQNTPLISINEKEKSESKKYFEEFYANSRYKTFLTSIQPAFDYRKVKGGKSVSVDLGINLQSLRADLESNNIIRKFGY